MSPLTQKDETVVHGCQFQGDLGVSLRKVLAIPQKSRRSVLVLTTTKNPQVWCPRDDVIIKENEKAETGQGCYSTDSY